MTWDYRNLTAATSATSHHQYLLKLQMMWLTTQQGSCKLQPMTDPAGSDIHSSSDSIRDYKALWNQRKNTLQPKLVFNVVRAVTM